MKLKDNDTDWK